MFLGLVDSLTGDWITGYLFFLVIVVLREAGEEEDAVVVGAPSTGWRYWYGDGFGYEESEETRAGLVWPGWCVVFWYALCRILTVCSWW